MRSSTPNKRPSCPDPDADDSGVNIRLTDISANGNDWEDLQETPTENGKGDFAVDIDKLKAIDEDSDDLDDERTLSVMSAFSSSCLDKLKFVMIALMCMLYAAYFVWALVIAGSDSCDDDHNVVPLVVLTVAILFMMLVRFVREKFGEEINKCWAPFNKLVEDQWHWLKWIVNLAPVAGILAIIAASAFKRISNLISLVGWLFLLCLLLLCSKAPRQVKWRPVVGGFLLQFYFATFILKSQIGYDICSGVGTAFTNFLNYSEFGAKFVFGKLDDHFFAFKVLPVIIFFSCVITMLYHLQVMQAVIGKIAFVMRITLGTTAAESLCAAGNIFVGQTEAPIMIRPFLAIMTRSELHAVMVGGFGTIAGAVLAAYIMKGVSATHLLTACVMNAPTALAVSKVLYPELGHSKIAQMQEAIDQKNVYNNFIEAAAAGASASISLVANVAANLIAFVALLYFTNSAISWFGSFVCYSELSFELICSYALMPLAYIMGVEWKDAGHVAQLLGIKTFLNEFIAYDHLSDYIDNRIHCKAGTVLSVRSETIATYALCGFANLSSIGMQLGGLGSMAPNRLGDLAQLAVTALFGGIVTNLMTACVAGLLVVEDPFDVSSCLNASSVVNGTIGFNTTLLGNSTMTSYLNGTSV